MPIEDKPYTTLNRQIKSQSPIERLACLVIVEPYLSGTVLLEFTRQRTVELAVIENTH